MCWLTDGAGRQLDTSVASLVKGHPSSLSFVQGYLRGKEWKAWRAQRQERAVTLKNPPRICHCQEFSAKAESGTPKQHKQTAETLHGTASDTVKERHERTFFSFCWRHDLCGVLFFRFRRLLFFQTQHWLTATPSVTISKVIGKAGKCTNNHRKMVNLLQTGQLIHYPVMFTI